MIEDKIGEIIHRYELAIVGEAMATVEARAGEPEIGAAWAAGRAMSEADAVAYALSTLAPAPAIAGRT